ncbi:hypothetical protein PHYPSEUDO_004566 [Phytophthora pseudosyringae]|uniref:Uncharacterized protein n=1 Tax=Phytophthora pseudosyringae TaxID=221518 RepID=A0A8T1WDM7_9STRA|nr:hypothetical protein PHYPSEUDO_004566 [Phytophthora pseudosyringae]
MVRHIWAIFHGTPHEGRTQVWRRVHAVRGEVKIFRSAFLANFNSVLVMLNAVSRIRFLQPTEEHADGVITRMLNVSTQGAMRVGTSALTYTSIVDAFIWLRIDRPDVTMKVLYDRHWCWTTHHIQIAFSSFVLFECEDPSHEIDESPDENDSSELYLQLQRKREFWVRAKH